MRVMLVGATGLVGQGALREWLLADDVERVPLVRRNRTRVTHPEVEDPFVPARVRGDESAVPGAAPGGTKVRDLERDDRPCHAGGRPGWRAETRAGYHRHQPDLIRRSVCF